MELETINKLFLELSQIATARTSRETKLMTAIAVIATSPHKGDGTDAMRFTLIAKEALNSVTQKDVK